MDSLSSVRLALSSVTMPMAILTRMTKPNTASFHEPVMSTSTIAVKMMPLKRVNTFARTMSLIERDVEVCERFTRPSSTRAAIWAASSPCSAVSGMDTVALMLPNTSAFTQLFGSAMTMRQGTLS